MFCCITFVLSVLVLLPGSSVASGGAQSYTALKFSNNPNSYISYRPDMSPLTNQFSLCLWIRKIRSSNHPGAFAYGGNELFMSDDGYFHRLFGTSTLDGRLTSKFTVPMGTWYLYCSTWSFASKTFRIYLNGALVGAQITASRRKLATGRYLVLGNWSENVGAHLFGGEMFNFNMYRKVLSSTEIATISASGLCGSIPEHLEAYRSIRWEDILNLRRSGIVQDFVDPTCAPLVKVGESYYSTQEELAGVRRELNETRAELVDTKEELRNLGLSKCAPQRGNLTKEEMLHGLSLYNQILTRDLCTELFNSWNAISGKVFGIQMTDQVIELVKDLDLGSDD